VSSKDEREQAFARTLQILGQQMHLIADLAVPAHTRNDPHCPLPEGFERWASLNAVTVQGLIAGPPKTPDPSIFTLGVPIPDDVANVPVARLWDSDQYNGSNPQVTLSPTIGQAEYTNANFFSDDTTFSTEQFPFPSRTSIELGEPEPTARPGQLRRYFKKVRDGELIDHLAVPSALYELLPDGLKDGKKGLDGRVFQDYAASLLPRAVGYSAALLGYFFRGALDVDLVADAGDPPRLKLVGKLVSSNGGPNELLAGSLALYWDDANGVRSPVAGFAPMSLAGVTGDPIASSPFLPPAGAERYVAVYQGTLGQEPGAVIGKVQVGSGGVEELFIDDATGDLHFRNRKVLTRLDVREQLTPPGAAIQPVIWGNDGMSFMVGVGIACCWHPAEWAIFELSARPARNATWVTPPTARLVRQEAFDVTWTAALGGGIADEVTTIVLDSRRDILYGGHRGREIDPYNYTAAVLVNHSRRETLIDYGIAILGEFGGGSVPYLVYADGADLAGTVALIKSWAYLDRDVWGYVPLPFRTSVWAGSAERVLHADTFGAPTNHELIGQFGWSDDPVLPHSTRRHMMYSVEFTDATLPYPDEAIVTRVYLYDVKTGASRVVAEDPVPYWYGPTPHLDRVWRYDFRGSANTGVDRLFQASSSTQLLGDEREAFFAAWDATTGVLLLDVTAIGYPPIDTAANDVAAMVQLPAGLTPVRRAIQVVE
jgi:hypothetical protein